MLDDFLDMVRHFQTEYSAAIYHRPSSFPFSEPVSHYWLTPIPPTHMHSTVLLSRTGSFKVNVSYDSMKPFFCLEDFSA